MFSIGALRAKLLSASALASVLFVAPAWAGALPSGGHFVSGKGEIGKAGQSLTVNQSSTTGIINWNSFSIGSKGAVDFNNGSGATLNRVTGGNLSKIAGSLHATGSLYLMNSAGVIVSGTGRVVTGGSFVASSSLSDSFQNEKLKRTTGAVTNRGTIVAGEGVTLAGQNVTDRGSISAASVNLHAAGKLKIGGTITALDADGSGGTVVATARHIAVGATANISASGTQGGTVLIGGDVHGGAIAGDNFVGQKVSTARTTRIASGAQISANASQSKGGNIVIWSNGHTTFAGAISAKGQSAGGFTEVSSHDLLGFTGRVDLTSAHGTTGTLLLDPENVVITDGTTSNGSIVSGTFTATGDDSILNVADLEAALATANLKVTTGGSSTGTQAGDITVLAPITWSSGHTLTLDANRSVTIDAPIAITGGGGLSIVTNDGGTGGTYSIGDGGFVDYGPTDKGGTLTINGTKYNLLYTMAQVQAINANLSGNYALATSLNAADVKAWTPIGTGTTNGVVEESSKAFSGVFEGLGNIISGLKIDLSSKAFVGLFGESSGTIRDIGLVGGSVKGGQFSGDLVGNNSGTIINAFTTGTVDGSDADIGGLAGYNSGTIADAFSTGAVTSENNYAGGLVGYNTGSLLVAYASGSVRGASNIGGFVGYNKGTIQLSYATGTVKGTGTGSADIGGFVGTNDALGSIDQAYETGKASGVTNVGGFVGQNAGNIGGTTEVYYNSSQNGSGSGSPGSGVTNVGGLAISDMMTSANFAGWIFNTTAGGLGWVIVDGDGTLNNAGSTAGGTTPMLLSEYSTNIVTAHQLQLMALDLSANYTLANNINLIGTGGNDVWGGAGFVPIGGNGAGSFAGEFNGNGYTISDLTIDNTANGFVGLFGELDGTISNVKLTKAKISSSVSASESGILVGTIDDGTVNGVSTSGTIKLNAISGFAGGLVGENDGIVESSSSSATVSNAETGGFLGGLVGYDSGSIEASSASGKVSGSGGADAGGLVGESYGEIINSHASGKITVAAAVGGSAGGLVGFDNTGGSVFGSYATGAVSADEGEGGGLIGQSSADQVVNSYATGAVSGNGGYFGGLIGYAANGAVSGSYATGKVTATYLSSVPSIAGGLIGFDSGYAVDNSYASGAVSADSTSAYAGGLIGNVTNGSVTDSHATGSVSVNGENTNGASAGGLIGEAQAGSKVAGSYATGSVTGDDVSYTGGLIGTASQANVIDNDYATGAVKGYYAGGLIGYSLNGNFITDSHASGTVTGVLNSAGLADVGGLIGQSSNDAELSSLYATGNINGGGTSSDVVAAGGLIGSVSGDAALISSYATGSVKNANELGGLVGYSVIAILDSYATGNITSSSFAAGAGGLVGFGYLGSSISNSYATGNVVASSGPDTFAGGLVGRSQGSIDNSFATGNVTGELAAGGLVGENNGTLNNAYATGATTGLTYVGGLIGINSGNIAQAYAIGDVSDAGKGGTVGGLIASNSGGTINAAYWDTQTSGQSKSAGGVGLTTAQLQSGLPAGFSSADWKIVAGKSFPYLAWQFASGTPEVISGTISGSDKAGVSVGVQVNGAAVTPIVTTSSGANGYYYELLAPGTIAKSGSNVLVFEDSGSNQSDVFIQKAEGSLSNIDLAANMLTIDGSAASETALLAAMENALGSSTGSDFLYTSAGNFTSGIDLDVNLSAAAFSLDHAINIGTGDLDIVAAGSITQGSDDAITASKLSGKSAGAATFNNTSNVITDLGVFTAGGNFALTDDQNLTVDGAVSAGSHTASITTVGSGHNVAIHAKLTGSTVNLVTAGNITESKKGDIDTALLNVAASTGITLTSKKNQITALGTHKTTSGPNKITL